MVNITKNFTLEELYASDTARAKGINNRPTTEAIGNLTGLEYDQMIEEGTWLHLSYRKGHNRKENLLYRNKRYIKDN